MNVKQSNIDMGLQGVSWHGCQSYYAKKTGVCLDQISKLFRGERRATLRIAAALEKEFNETRVPLDRWDLLYGIKVGSETLAGYLLRKNSGEVHRA